MPELPKQVQEQLDAAEALQQPEAQAPPPDDQPPADPAAPDPQPEDASPPAETPPASEAPQPTEAEKWEHKYRSLQGVLENEQRRGRDQFAEMSGKLNDALKQISDLTAKLTAAPAPAPEPSVTAKDVEAFGPELVDLAKRIAGDAITAASVKWDQERGELLARIDTLSKKTTEEVASIRGESQKQTFESQLLARMPDLWEVNANESFKDWCRAPDPLSGEPRQLSLERFIQANDVEKVVNYFNQWKATATPAQPAADPKAALARQVTPQSTRATPPAPDDVSKKIWTVDEIDQFYSEVRKGKFQGDAAATEALIDQAVAEGRIKQ